MNRCKNCIWAKLALILFWCTFWTDADPYMMDFYWSTTTSGIKTYSYVAPYYLVGLLALYFWVVRTRSSSLTVEIMEKPGERLTNGYAFILASAVVLAHYRMFVCLENGGLLTGLAEGRFAAYKGIVEAVLLLGVGFCLFREILDGVRHCGFLSSDEAWIQHRKRIFWCCWGLLVAEYAAILYGSQYPGIVQYDSVVQIQQILGLRSYSNAHPYYYTQIIHVAIAFGLKVFGDINKAIVVYSFFSIVIMASCFMYVVETAYMCTKNRKIALAIFLFYLLLPVHIMYSILMVKDVFFGAAVTGFAVSCYRALKSVGNAKYNWALLFLTSLGMGLLRSNGWVAFLATVLAFAALFGKKQKKMLLVLLAALVLAFVLKHPVLQALRVSQPDTIEALAIPQQQIARVITDYRYGLTKGQEQLLGKIVDISKIPIEYKACDADYVKRLVRQKRNQRYLRNHASNFVKLYIKLGLKYPHKYVEAWIDQTKGYWNGGYSYRKWWKGVHSMGKGLGMRQTVKSPTIHNVIMKYLEIWETTPFLQLFLSIGVYVWGIVVVSYRAWMKKNREVLFLTVPFLAVVATLMVAVPIFSETRYAYAVFCGFPFLLAIAFAKDWKEIDDCIEKRKEDTEFYSIDGNGAG